MSRSTAFKRIIARYLARTGSGGLRADFAATSGGLRVVLEDRPSGVTIDLVFGGEPVAGEVESKIDRAVASLAEVVLALTGEAPDYGDSKGTAAWYRELCSTTSRG